MLDKKTELEYNINIERNYNMAFPKDGSNHHSALLNEDNTKKYLQKNAHKIFDAIEKDKYTVIPKGGTQNKADNVIECNDGKIIYISDKEKKKGLGGSFDYTNTSKPINTMLNNGSECTKEIQSLLDRAKEDKKLPIEERKKLVESYRPRVKKASYEFLNSLTSDEIKTLIKNYLIEPNKEMQEFISDGKENKRYTFPFMKHPVIDLIENDYTASIKFKKDDGENSSGYIVFSKGDEEVNVGLRMRVHTNNGVTALLNAGGSNKSSQFVIKFQQDGIKNLLKTIGVSAIEI
tara:strand:- start:1005 stop:1877 length:873 start_codon:yes stop_codon:yes gene_type:complete